MRTATRRTRAGNDALRNDSPVIRAFVVHFVVHSFIARVFVRQRTEHPVNNAYIQAESFP